MGDMLHVVADTYTRAYEFARTLEIAPYQIILIDKAMKIKGLKPPKLHVLYGAGQLPEFHEIMKEAKLYNIDVEYVWQ